MNEQMTFFSLMESSKRQNYNVLIILVNLLKRSVCFRYLVDVEEWILDLGEVFRV